MPNDKIAAIGHKSARPDGDIGSFGQTPSLQPRTEISKKDINIFGDAKIQKKVNPNLTNSVFNCCTQM